MSPSQRSDRLDSWKEVAEYLQRNERTVQRWEGERGLPIHRIPGDKRGAVYGYRDEIDAWLAGQAPGSLPEVAPQRRPIKKWVAGIGLMVIGLAAVVFVTRHGHSALPLKALISLGPQPARVSVTTQFARAWDESGHELWTYHFPKPIDASAVPRSLDDFVRIADVDGDGQKEVLIAAPTKVGLNPDDPPRGEVVCLSSDGKLLWSYIPQADLRVGDNELRGPWSVYDLLVSSEGPKTRIWVAVAHYRWGNSLVVELDPKTGRGTLRFVNNGVIWKLAEMTTPSGAYLLAGGFNSEYDSGVLALVNEDRPFAASPQTGRYRCTNCPAGAPDFVLAFPRSEINQWSKIYEDPVRSIVVNNEGVAAAKFALKIDPNVYVVYLFDATSNIRPISLRFDSGYDMMHNELSAANKLKHDLEHCPERLHPLPVKLWTPASGWTELTFPTSSSATQTAAATGKSRPIKSR